MPITIPVPKSYAAKFDAKQPNEYDADPDQAGVQRART